mmetsp:Transcript_42851/g.93083  ORF Transcript_42851/g.93083 Transcript_42851/m.93083 type:complete len:246 (-) Transcript_42851:21-758(-)
MEQALDRADRWPVQVRKELAQELMRRFDAAGALHCAETPLPEELEEHRASCRMREAWCGSVGCSAHCSAHRLSEHQASCGFVQLPCQQECGAMIRRMDMEQHTEGPCLMKRVHCPFRCIGCSAEMAQGEVPTHLSDAVSDHVLLAAAAAEKHQQQLQGLDSELEECHGRLNFIASMHDRMLEASEADTRHISKTLNDTNDLAVKGTKAARDTTKTLSKSLAGVKAEVKGLQDWMASIKRAVIDRS